ncbi:hypothetical protein PspLS_05235 [Pyricularia sp. CBS 133598]|nr:hypothetical protein PspLS_05235 [Pyricularia sp. CBS 133598]
MFPTSARERIRAGTLVVSRDGVVDVDEQAGVAGVVHARDGDHARRRCRRARPARDGDLRARDVQLGAADGARAVQRDVLDAEQVVAAGDALGDRDVDAGFVCVPGQPVIANAGLVLQDLQPPGAGAVPGRGRLALGNEAEPGRERAGVADGGLGRVGDGGAGGHVNGQRGGATRVELVARHLRRLHVGHGPVALVVGRLPHRLPVARALASDLDRREGVCGRCMC